MRAIVGGSYMSDIHYLQCMFHYPVNILTTITVSICKVSYMLILFLLVVNELLCQQSWQGSKSLRPSIVLIYKPCYVLIT